MNTTTSCTASLPALDAGRIDRRRVAALLLVYLAVVAVQAMLVSDTPLMSVYYDEFLYDQMAVEMAEGKLPTLNQVRPPRYPPLYSALLVPLVWMFGEDRFLAIRLLNVVMASTILFAVYALARRLVRPEAALIAAVAAVIGPSAHTTALVLSENLYLPLICFYLLAVVRLLERPTYPRSALVGLLAAAALATKLSAAVPIGVAGLFLLCRLPVPGPRRWRLVALQAGIFLVLVTPWAAWLLTQSFVATAHEAGHGDRASVLQFGTAVLNHLLALVIGLGPFAAGLALAVGLRRGNAGLDPDRLALSRLFLYLVLATVAVSAIWITLARPTELRVEERYQFAAYPLVILLAVGGIERPPRGAWIGFVLASVFLLVMPSYQLDTQRGAFWYHVNPSPLLLHGGLPAMNTGWVRLLFVGGWAVLAAVFLALRRGPARRIAWAGILAPGFYLLILVGGPMHLASGLEVGNNSADLVDIHDLLDRHTTPADGIVFGGLMPDPIPYTVSILHRMPCWHQASLESPDWFPGTFDHRTGRLTWSGRPIRRLFLLARDHVTRGGRLVDRAGPWRLYRLDKNEPALHSLLVKNHGPAAGDEVTQHVEIYLWRMRAGQTRRLFLAPVGGQTVSIKYLLYEPYLETDWTTTNQPETGDIPRLTKTQVSKLELKVKKGTVLVEIEEAD